MSLNKFYTIGLWIVIVSLVFIPLFVHLDVHPIRIWDEARVAMNAYEMYYNNNWLVTFYEGAPETWNTKPPLLIWLQVAFMNLLSPNELAVRLPSAFAALFTCVLILGLSRRYLKSTVFGLAAALILVTSVGYTQFHVSRSGDYDALLVFFMTAYAFSFFAFIETEKSRWRTYFFIFRILAILTKSIQAVLFMPALVMYLAYSRKLILLFSRQFIVGSVAVILIVGAYYLLRESQSQGYFQAVMENELGGRYLEVNEGNDGVFLYYFILIFNHHFNPWFWFFPAGIILAWFSRNSKLKKTIVFSVLIALSYWLIISFSQTKLEWYEAPLFPFLSLISAVPIYLGVTLINRITVEKGIIIRRVIPALIILVVFYNPYLATVKRVYKSSSHSWEKGIYEIGYVLQQSLRNEKRIPDYDICFEGYHAHLRFYADIISKRGTSIESLHKEDLKPGDVVWVSQPEVKQYIESNYGVRVLDSYLEAAKYEVLNTL
ncbi:MAG: glycosyltransferase family 39 protein [Bacteroidia bacterium]